MLRVLSSILLVVCACLSSALADDSLSDYSNTTQASARQPKGAAESRVERAVDCRRKR